MSRKQKRMDDLRAAKDRKMKKVAAGLSVVLAIVLVIEVPSMLKGTSGPTPTPAATTTAAPTGTPSTATPAVTAPGTAAAAVAPTTNAKLPNSDTQPRAGKAQLYSFSQFTGKDPFVQQVVDLTAGLPDAETTAATQQQQQQQQSGSVLAQTKTRKQTGRTLAATRAARISVNGRLQIVRVGTSFPSGNPLFRLVSISGGVVRIGIAGGSYSSGAKTVSLVPGRSLTLVDTADGIRYRLRLLS